VGDCAGRPGEGGRPPPLCHYLRCLRAPLTLGLDVRRARCATAAGQAAPPRLARLCRCLPFTNSAGGALHIAIPFHLCLEEQRHILYLYLSPACHPSLCLLSRRSLVLQHAGILTRLQPPAFSPPLMGRARVNAGAGGASSAPEGRRRACLPAHARAAYAPRARLRRAHLQRSLPASATLACSHAGGLRLPLAPQQQWRCARRCTRYRRGA